MRIDLSKKDIITYKTDDGVLIKNDTMEIHLEKDALIELINDSETLGIIDKVETEVIEKVVYNDRVVEKVVEKPINHGLDYKKIFLISLIFNLFFLTYVVLSIMFYGKNLQENKTVIEIHSPSVIDTLTNFQLEVGENPLNKENYKIIIKKSENKTLGMWPIVKENGLDIYTNHIEEFDGDVSVGYYGIIESIKDITVANKRVGYYKQLGYKNSGLFYRKSTKFSEGTYLIYLFKEDLKQNVMDKHKKTNVKFIQTILK